MADAAVQPSGQRGHRLPADLPGAVPLRAVRATADLHQRRAEGVHGLRDRRQHRLHTETRHQRTQDRSGEGDVRYWESVTEMLNQDVIDRENEQGRR